MPKKQAPTVLIMSYSDSGIALNDFDTFIEACKAFKTQAELQYTHKNIEMHFLPEGLAKVMMDTMGGGNETIN